MKELIEKQLADALAALKSEGTVPQELAPAIAVTRTRDASHGDFASNLALLLAKPARRSPRELAEEIIRVLTPSDAIREVTVAGPGFINFFVADDAQSSVIQKVLEQGDGYGKSEVGKGQRIQVEFVSANPTGPLHVGHGRGAALGDSIANLLSATGFDVEREYYVNDAGRQMRILALSVWLRYLELCGESIPFPSNGYKGDYVHEISQSLKSEVGDSLRQSASAIFDGIAADEVVDDQEVKTGDKEAHVDELIIRMEQLLGDSAFEVVFKAGLDLILADIRADLEGFGVHYDNWFSERSLTGDVSSVLERLEASGHLYVKDGVTWFRSTEFGDDKDRPVLRSNGQSTYFASDIAYIDNKLSRGFDRVVYAFGSDHHGYVARMKAACVALGHSGQALEFVLIQFAILYRGSERIQMSTRSGSFVTLRELREEVGKDAARYFYVMRKYQQHLDFDLELATSQSNDNPVYYVQYAYARICSVERQFAQRDLVFDQARGMASLALLNETAETHLLTLLATYPEMIERAALAREPHQVTGYLRDLANGLHSYYNAHKVLVEDESLRDARFCLLLAVRQVLANGLELIAVSTPEVM